MKTNTHPNVLDLARWIDLQLSTITEGVSAGYTLGNYNSVWIDKGATVFNVSLANGATVEIDSDNYNTAEEIATAIIATLNNTPTMTTNEIYARVKENEFVNAPTHRVNTVDKYGNEISSPAWGLDMAEAIAADCRAKFPNDKTEIVEQENCGEIQAYWDKENTETPNPDNNTPSAMNTMKTATTPVTLSGAEEIVASLSEKQVRTAAEKLLPAKFFNEYFTPERANIALLRQALEDHIFEWDMTVAEIIEAAGATKYAKTQNA